MEGRSPARQKKQSRVVGFFWACLRRHYIREHPALALGKVKVVHIPTDYFPPKEFQKILDAINVYGDPRGGFIPLEDLRTRLHTMTLLMRWSGLRIRDAITLERDRLHGDSLLLYQAKTGTLLLWNEIACTTIVFCCIKQRPEYR